jgi:hypothetical protein
MNTEHTLEYIFAELLESASAMLKAGSAFVMVDNPGLYDEADKAVSDGSAKPELLIQFGDEPSVMARIIKPNGKYMTLFRYQLRRSPSTVMN